MFSLCHGLEKTSLHDCNLDYIKAHLEDINESGNVDISCFPVILSTMRMSLVAMNITVDQCYVELENDLHGILSEIDFQIPCSICHRYLDVNIKRNQNQFSHITMVNGELDKYNDSLHFGWDAEWDSMSHGGCIIDKIEKFLLNRLKELNVSNFTAIASTVFSDLKSEIRTKDSDSDSDYYFYTDYCYDMKEGVIKEGNLRFVCVECPEWLVVALTNYYIGFVRNGKNVNMRCYDIIK